MVVNIQEFIDAVISSDCDELVVVGRNTETDKMEIWSTHSAQSMDDLLQRVDRHLEELGNDGA